MRIGITCYPTYGGSGIVATELGSELAQRGHEVHFITYSNPIRLDPAQPRVYFHEVEVSSYPLFQHPPYMLALASRMAEIAEWQNLDLLHVHYAIPHSASAMLARQMVAARRRLPYVTTLHGTDITIVGTDRAYFPITQYTIEQSDAVTSISEDLRRETIEVFHIQREIRVIPNFVNCDLYKPARERHAGRPRLLHISNFRAVKRVTDCVRILAEVRRHVDAELWMAVSYTHLDVYKRQASRYPLSPWITTSGRPPTRVATGTTPQAIASSAASPKDSWRLGSSSTSHCGISRSMWSCLPRKRTASCTPNSCASASRCV